MENNQQQQGQQQLAGQLEQKAPALSSSQESGMDLGDTSINDMAHMDPLGGASDGGGEAERDGGVPLTIGGGSGITLEAPAARNGSGAVLLPTLDEGAASSNANGNEVWEPIPIQAPGFVPDTSSTGSSGSPGGSLPVDPIGTTS
eukprot:evm.model.NODE_41583_length_16315_cov_18.662397.1